MEGGGVNVQTHKASVCNTTLFQHKTSNGASTKIYGPKASQIVVSSIYYFIL